MKFTIFSNISLGEFSKNRELSFRFSFGDIYFVIFAKLVNQNLEKYNSFITQIWITMAFILAVIFPNLILSSLLLNKVERIDNIDELIKSNLTLVADKHSAIISIFRDSDPSIDPRIGILKKRLKEEDYEVLFLDLDLNKIYFYYLNEIELSLQSLADAFSLNVLPIDK
jgi:hypothetical protein